MGNNPPKKEIKTSKTFVVYNHLYDSIFELNNQKDELDKKLKKAEYNYKNVTEVNKRLQNLINIHSQKIREKENKINQNETLNKELKEKINEFERKEVQNQIIFDDYLKKQENLKLENEQIKKLKKQIDQEKDEKKRKELMEKRRISNLKYSFKKKYRNYKSEKVHIILKDFEDNKSKTFCIEDISELIKGKTVNIIRDIFTTEIIVTPIKTQLKNFIKNAKRRIKKVKNLNIILVGPSGAGKSTLINKILNVKADIGFGLPVTEKIEMYSSEEIPFLRLVDSRGIEKDPKADINFIYQEISNYIKKQIETNDPDKFIHCIWYCWAADTRLEEVEFNLLKQLGEEYTLDKLPIIIVYTKAISIDSVEKAKKFLKERNIENDFADILAVEMKTKTNDSKIINVIPPFGLDK